jgi:hypothetical protein
VDEGRVVFGDGLEEVAPTLTPLSVRDWKLSLGFILDYYK